MEKLTTVLEQRFVDGREAQRKIKKKVEALIKYLNYEFIMIFSFYLPLVEKHYTFKSAVYVCVWA
jgi:hypothetical protein